MTGYAKIRERAAELKAAATDAGMQAIGMELERKERQYPHYHKHVGHLQTIDVYRVLFLFEVTNPCIQHAVKKLLCAGKRGGKDFEKDLREAWITIGRAIEMLDEDRSA